MASATRNGVQRKAQSDVEEPRHPGLRSDCWAGARVTMPDDCHCELAVWARPARRGPRRPPQSTSLHRLRPSRPAEARLPEGEGQLLTD
jgi:hypothetical protein